MEGCGEKYGRRWGIIRGDVGRRWGVICAEVGKVEGGVVGTKKNAYLCALIT